MLKELAVLISNLSYSDMMEWCGSDAFGINYDSEANRPKKMAAWAKRESQIAETPAASDEPNTTGLVMPVGEA